MTVLKLWTHDPHPIYMRRNPRATFDYWAFCRGCAYLGPPRKSREEADADDQQHSEKCKKSDPFSPIAPEQVAEEAGDIPDLPTINGHASRSSSYRRWTEEEDSIVSQYLPADAFELLQEFGTGRTMSAVHGRRETLSKRGVTLSRGRIKDYGEDRARRAWYQIKRANCGPVVCPKCYVVIHPGPRRATSKPLLEHWDGPCNENIMIPYEKFDCEEPHAHQ